MKTKYAIATIKKWNFENFEKFYGTKDNFILINRKEDLKASCLVDQKISHIFFPHWSWIIPPEIYEKFICVVFHMTDLPYGRGGSPLQNLIIQGHETTKISAIKVVKDLDAGPIYLKEDLSLEGSAQEIYSRSSDIIFSKMIKKIIENDLSPSPQKGEVTIFRRRNPSESKITGIKGTNSLYNFIRMLDADSYPNAFIENDNFIFKFKNAKIKDGKLVSEVEISPKD